MAPNIEVRCRDGSSAHFMDTGRNDGSYLMQWFVPGKDWAVLAEIMSREYVAAFLFEACQEFGTTIIVRGN